MNLKISQRPGGDLRLRCSHLATGVAAAFLALASQAWAEDAPATPPTQPVHFGALYDGEVMGVAAGGLGRGATYLDQLMLSADVDFDRAVGWKGATAHVDVLSSHGGQPSDRTGSSLGIDRNAIEARPVRLVQAYVQQAFAKGRVSVLLGFYDIANDFSSVSSADLFIGPTGALAPELAASGPNGPSDAPETALTLRVRVQPTPSTYLAVMAANARSGDLGDASGPDFSFRDGLFLAAEAGYTASARFAVGAWTYTQRQPDIRDLGASGNPVLRAARGVYGLAEYPLYAPPDGVRKTTAFLRVGISEGKTTSYSASWKAGILIEHLFRSRPESTLAFGGIAARFDGRFRANGADTGLAVGASETGFELTYSDRIAPHVKLQPDLQWVHRPSGQRAIGDVIVTGLRVEIEL